MAPPILKAAMCKTSKSNGTPILKAAMCKTSKSNGIPILNVIMCKNRRSGDRAKPDFDGLLGVGAWGRASGSRFEVHSATPSPKQTIWYKRYTNSSNGIAINLLLLCFLYPHPALWQRKRKSRASQEPRH